MAKRKRDVPVLFWVSAEELELIHQKMQQYGTENLSAYLRKMALDGYTLHKNGLSGTVISNNTIYLSVIQIQIYFF